MTSVIWTYAAFLTIGLALTCWVASTQRRHGVTFSTRGDLYDHETGPAMCHLLIVGFCLVCFGVVSLAVGAGSRAQTLQEVIESLSAKLGWVIMAIGLMHFAMLKVFAVMGHTHRPGLPPTDSTPAETTHSVSALLRHRDVQV